MSPVKTKIKQYPKIKDYFRETCKSQNINRYSPTPMFNFGIIKRLSTILVLSSIKIYLSIQFQYLTFQPDLESGVC